MIVIGELLYTLSTVHLYCFCMDGEYVWTRSKILALN